MERNYTTQMDAARRLSLIHISATTRWQLPSYTMTTSSAPSPRRSCKIILHATP